MRHSIVTLIALGVAAPASADTPASVQAELGFRFGSANINGVDSGPGNNRGVYGSVGIRPRPLLLLYTEYEVAVQQYRAPALPDDSARGGLVPAGGTTTGIEQRLGIAARYTVDRFGDFDHREGGWFDMWVEAGAGLEHFNWDAGGVWTRPDVALGVGFTLGGRFERRFHGLTFALRVQFAPKQSSSDQLACGGPCDAPSAATGWDRSAVFEIGWAFGR